MTEPRREERASAACPNFPSSKDLWAILKPLKIYWLSEDRMHVVEHRLSVCADAYVRKRTMSTAMSEEELRIALKSISTFTDAMLALSGDRPNEIAWQALKDRSSDPPLDKLLDPDVVMAINRGAINNFPRGSQVTHGIATERHPTVERVSQALRVLCQLDAQCRELIIKPQSEVLAAGLEHLQRETRQHGDLLRDFAAMAANGVDLLSRRIDHAARRRKDQRVAERLSAQANGQTAPRYAKGVRRNKPFDDLLGGLWSIYLDLTDRLPRTQVGAPGTDHEGEAGGAFLAFIKAFLRCLKAAQPKELSAHDPVMAAELDLFEDAIRSRVRNLGLTEKFLSRRKPKTP